MSLDHAYSTILKTHRIFASLTGDEVTKLLQFAKIVSLDKSQHLFKQGDPAHNFYFIVDGKMKLFRLLKDGSEKIIKIMKNGDTFAHAIILKKQQHYPVCAQAVTGAKLIAFRNADYLQLVKNNHDLALEMMSSMSDNMNQLIHDIEILSLKDSTSRVVHYFHTLLQENEKHGTTDKITLPAAKHMIASMLAIQPETLSRIFHRLRDQGMIEIHGSSITLLKRELLENY